MNNNSAQSSEALLITSADEITPDDCPEMFAELYGGREKGEDSHE